MIGPIKFKVRLKDPGDDNQLLDSAGFPQSWNDLLDFLFGPDEDERVVYADASQGDVVTSGASFFNNNQVRYPALRKPPADEIKGTGSTEKHACEAEEGALEYIQMGGGERYRDGYNSGKESGRGKSAFRRYRWEPYDWGNLFYTGFFFFFAVLCHLFASYALPDVPQLFFTSTFRQKVVNYEILTFVLGGIYPFVDGFSYIKEKIYVGRGERRVPLDLVESLGQKYFLVFLAALLIPALVYGFAGPWYMFFLWIGIFLLALALFGCFVIYPTVTTYTIGCIVLGIFWCMMLL